MIGRLQPQALVAQNGDPLDLDQFLEPGHALHTEAGAGRRGHRHIAPSYRVHLLPIARDLTALAVEQEVGVLAHQAVAITAAGAQHGVEVTEGFVGLYFDIVLPKHLPIGIERALRADEQHVVDLPAMHERQIVRPSPVPVRRCDHLALAADDHPHIEHQQRALAVEPAANLGGRRTGRAEIAAPHGIDLRHEGVDGLLLGRAIEVDAVLDHVGKARADASQRLTQAVEDHFGLHCHVRRRHAVLGINRQDAAHEHQSAAPDHPRHTPHSRLPFVCLGRAGGPISLRARHAIKARSSDRFRVATSNRALFCI